MFIRGRSLSVLEPSKARRSRMAMVQYHDEPFALRRQVAPLRIPNLLASNAGVLPPHHEDHLAYLVYSPAYGQSRKMSVSPMSAYGHASVTGRREVRVPLCSVK
jgi:hypothetical protein